MTLDILDSFLNDSTFMSVFSNFLHDNFSQLIHLRHEESLADCVQSFQILQKKMSSLFKVTQKIKRKMVIKPLRR